MAEPAPGQPPAPRLLGAIRGAAIDFYFNSWRLVPANLAWSATLLGIIVLAASVSALSLLLVPLLSLPTVGIYRLAALIVRGEPAALSDAFTSWRRFGGPAIALGATILATGTVFGFNIWTGLLRGDMIGWSLATLAAWGLAALALLACATWPVLVDPRREALGQRARLRLAVLLIVAHPVRLGALALVMGVILSLSTVAFAALLTGSISFLALVASRYVLPAADRLEARLAVTRP